MARFLMILLLAGALVAGCTATDTTKKMGYQLATLELVERDVATPEQIADRIETVRSALDSGQSLTFTVLAEVAREASGYNDLSPQGRVVVDALISDVRTGVGVVAGEVLTRERIEAVRQRLDWIEQAVRQ